MLSLNVDLFPFRRPSVPLPFPFRYAGKVKGCFFNVSWNRGLVSFFFNQSYIYIYIYIPGIVPCLEISPADQPLEAACQYLTGYV